MKTILCLARVCIIIYTLLVNLLARSSILLPSNRGPLSVLYSGVNVGVYFISICYLVAMLRPGTQHELANLVNLLAEGRDSRLIGRTKRLQVGITVFLHSAFSIFIYPIFKLCLSYTTNIASLEAEARWHIFVELDDNKTVRNTADGGQEELQWWKKLIGFIFLFADIDQQTLCLGSALVLLIVIAKTLVESCTCFAASVRKTQNMFGSSDQLFLAARFLSLPDTRLSSRSTSTLRKNIMIHEISSGKVGLNWCNIFIVTYSFVAAIICLIRISLVCFLFLGRLRAHTLFPTDKGPLGILLAGFYVGQQIMCLCYMITMLRSNTHNGLLELINLIRTDVKRGALSSTKRFRIIGKVLFFSFVFVIASTSLKIHSVINLGLEKELQQKWYRIVELDENKANDIILSADKSQEYFPLWKGIISFLFVLSDVDQQGFIGGGSLVLLVLVAKTLESVCVHFASSIRDV
ncbi:unnamed protein product [Orchesella dallaii]|uniref:Gustatory receptor n=1 Tax=Orchesella dallaii TaxID=48710 RepID=A0ABP1S6A5_9HEXA